MTNVSKEFYEMFNTMDEGIVLFKNELISFSNDTFKEIFKSFDDDGLNLVKNKLFKIYKNEKIKINIKKDEKKNETDIELYSIADIMLGKT